MADPLSFSDYRAFLRAHYESARQQIPNTSRSTFARRLGIAPHRLGEVLAGKEGISRERARTVADRLGLSHEAAENFCDLVSSEHERSKELRVLARKRIERRRAAITHDTIDPADFEPISDWYYFAILALVDVESLSSATIAERLSLPRSRVIDALRRLERFHLVARKTTTPVTWTVTGAQLEVRGGMPSPAVRKFHRQLLERALGALEEIPVSGREFVSLLIRARACDLAHIREQIRDFWSGLERDLERAVGKKELYALAVQFYPFAP